MTRMQWLVGAMTIGSISALLFAERPTWDCRAKMELKNATFGQGSRAGITTSSKVSGSLITVSGGPSDFYVNLRGNGRYRFEYSSNVSAIRLFIRDSLVYSGAPLTSYVGRGDVRIEPQWTGENVSIEVMDNCSPGSIVKGLLH